jgi:hypothetical protein
VILGRIARRLPHITVGTPYLAAFAVKEKIDFASLNSGNPWIPVVVGFF